LRLRKIKKKKKKKNLKNAIFYSISIVGRQLARDAILFNEYNLKNESERHAPRLSERSRSVTEVRLSHAIDTLLRHTRAHTLVYIYIYIKYTIFDHRMTKMITAADDDDDDDEMMEEALPAATVTAATATAAADSVAPPTISDDDDDDDDDEEQSSTLPERDEEEEEEEELDTDEREKEL